MKAPRVLIGCAGWSLPRAEQARFPGAGSHLERYAAQLPAAEINSSFHRPHRPATWERWREAVPEDFRFSVKVPKAISHECRLAGAEALLAAFLAGASLLGSKLAALLVQLPPSFVFDAALTRRFFKAARDQTDVPWVCEPRHASWFESEADALLAELEVARVAADPARVPAAARPGGWRGVSYFRLHGSPKMYYSAYSAEYLAGLAGLLRIESRAGAQTWCIFDNTTLGAAAGNALDLHHSSGSAATALSLPEPGK